MIPKETPPGTEFWSYDWGRVWHTQILYVSDKNVAYLQGYIDANQQNRDEVKLVDQSRAFLSEMEAVISLAEESYKKMTEAQSSAFHWVKEVEKLKRKEKRADA